MTVPAQQRAPASTHRCPEEHSPEAPHVLHLTKRMPAAAGGDAVVVSHLRRAQHASGWRTSVLTSRCPDILDAPGVFKTGLPLRQQQIDTIGPRRVLSLLITALSAWRLLRRLRPDVVHAHTVDLGAALAPACILLGIPRVITLHGTSIGNPWFSAAKRRLELAMLRAGGYTVVLTVDPTTVAVLRAATSLPVRAVLNAVPIEDFPPRTRPAPDGPLLFVGRLEDVKGVDVLLDALALSASSGVLPCLDVVGDGSQRQALTDQAHRLGLAGRVRFLGLRPAQEVASRMREASALVLPSRFEGLALVLLEAWAAGLPVVTSDAGAVPAICRDGQECYVVPVADPAALASAIEKVIADPAAAQAMAVRARARTEQAHSYPAMAATLQDVYEQSRATAGGSALVVNSVHQILATALMAAAGALFWLLAARLYSSEDVGRATALISASSVVSLVSLAGFHTTFLRFLATSPRRSAYLDTGMVISGGGGLLLAAAYLVVLPQIAPELTGVREHWASVVAFILVTCATSVNTLTDAAFMSLRAARFNLIFDGGIQSAGRLLTIALLASSGYLGIFAASGVGTVAATVGSLVVLVRRFGYRPRGRIDRSVIADVRAYAAGNHLAYVLNLLPTLLIPVIALHFLGAADAGHLYLAFMVANVFFGAAYAITSATFAETSYEEQPLSAVLRRSAMALAVVVVPATVGLALLGRPVLEIFGPGYADGAAAALAVFGLSTPLVGAYDLATVVLRVQRRTLAHIVVQAVFCVTVVGMALWLQELGTVGLATAWLTGTAVGLLSALVALRCRTPVGGTPTSPTGQVPAVSKEA